jgi:DNA helicase HerA-like ATPase
MSEPIGHVISVRGSRAQVGLPAPTPRGAYRPTVGGFLSMASGDALIVGTITQVEASISHEQGHQAIAHVDLTGEIIRSADGRTTFRRGVRSHPAIGDVVHAVTSEDLKIVYGSLRARSIEIGRLGQDQSVPAYVEFDSLLAKHFAVVGSTGVGKSSGVAVILNAMIRTDPSLRILVLDGHNEYGRSFGAKAHVTGADDLKLPFWMFNFEEMTDVIYGGRPAVADEVDILAELIPVAKGMYQSYKTSADRPGLSRRLPRANAFTADTPTPYLLQDLLSLIDERMGKLENRSTRMTYHRLMGRIESIKNDPRYSFMFENANVGGDTMAAVLGKLFRLDDDGKPVTVLRLASLPGEAVDAVVCVSLRLAFEFGLWSDGALPLLVVCEEAHRYASADHSVGFGPARRSLSRIAKEGRKYGVHLALISQRPAELDPTIISQCSTLFAMRMSNEQDLKLLRTAASDVAAHLLDVVPSLGTGEVIGVGEAMPLPARLSFQMLPRDQVPSSEMSSYLPDAATLDRKTLVQTVVERWRKAAVAPPLAEEEAPATAPVVEQRSSILKGPLPGAAGDMASLLDQTRSSILKR